MANRNKSRETAARALPEFERVALYCRVSSDAQAKEMTIDRQVSVVREVYERYYSGHPMAQQVGLYKDEAYNLEAVDETRNFWKIVKMIREGTVNVLIVVAEDRIFRGESAALRGIITDVFRHNRVKLITSSGVQVYDPNETSSRIASSVTQEMGAVSKLESLKTMHDARRRKLEERGDWFLNVTPYGLRCRRYMEGRVKKYSYEIQEDEAQFVRDVYRLYVGQKPKILPPPETGGRLGATKIAKILQEYGVSREKYVEAMPFDTATNGWDRQKVLRMLVNETYCGKLVVNFNPTKKISGFDRKRTVKTIEVPAIVDEALFSAAQEVLRKIREKLLDDRQPRTETNWLHGFVTCPECGSKLIGRVAGNANADRYYGCENFHGRLYRAEDIEQEVEKYLKSLLLTEANFKKLLELANKRLAKSVDKNKIEKTLSRKAADKADLESKLDALLEKLLSGIITDSQFTRFKEKIEQDLGKVNEDIRNLETQELALSVSKVSIESFQEIKEALARALQNDDKKEKILKLTANALIKSIRLSNDFIEISRLSNEEIRQAYQSGRLTLMDLRKHFGWYAKKVYSNFGKNSRKSRIDYKVEVDLKF